MRFKLYEYEATLSKEMFRHQFDYHRHTTFRLLDLAANLGE
jgi:hypothetical protein